MRATLNRMPCLGILFCAVPGIMLSERFPCFLPAAVCAAICFGAATYMGRQFYSCVLLVFTAFFIRHDLDWRENAGRLPIDLLSQGASVIEATGVVTSDPVVAGYAYHLPHWRFEMWVSGLTNDGVLIKARFPVQVYWTGQAPAWGDKVAVKGAIAQVPPPRNPGEFNLATYLARRGIFAELTCDYPEDGRILAHGKGNPLIAWARRSREALRRRLTVGIDDDPEIAGIVETITLGIKEDTSGTDRELFQHVGALHLFVVNGLHVALLASILGLLLRPLGIRRRTFALVIVPILFAYALLTGLNPGSVRAAIMAAVMFGATFVERRPFSFNTLAAAALILLLWDTNELFKTGFQFSFGLVAAIILLAEVIQKPILSLGVPDPFLPRRLWTPWQRMREAGWRQVSGLAGISLAASVGSFPFSAGYFNLVTPSGFAANLILVPIAFCILGEGIFSLLASVASSLGVLFNNMNWLLATGMLGVVHFFALLPGGHFFVSTAQNLPECRITVLDLKPGEATVIQGGASTWLVDCGSQSSYARTIRPFLQSCGINRLDGLILTHGAADSIGAYQEAIDDFAPRGIYESSVTDRSSTRRAFHAALEKAELPKTALEPGDALQMGAGVSCTALFPPAGFVAGKAMDKSLVLLIEHGGTRVLLMSDSAFTGEHWLMEHSRDLKASIVVLGGQSADLAGTDEFMSAVHPYAAIRGAPGFTAEAGEERRWAGGLYRQGVTPFLQSESGAVTIDVSQSGASIAGFVNGQRLVRRSD